MKTLVGLIPEHGHVLSAGTALHGVGMGTSSISALARPADVWDRLEGHNKLHIVSRDGLVTCNWNCVYCQLGRTRPVTNERKGYYPREEILAEVRAALAAHRTGEIDWVTFVGSGEPTLHSGIGWLIQQVKALTGLPAAVITNGALLYQPLSNKGEMMDIVKSLDNYRIGIFGKGGSGKSTLAVFLARALTRRGYDVCVLDADSTNVGLHRALGIDQPIGPLLDYFGGMVFSGGAVTCPVDDPTLLPGAELALEQLPPAYYTHSPEGILLLTAGKIGEEGPGAGCDGPVAKIARDVRVTGFGEHPVTLVDFKAGFEDAARGAITSLDLVLVTVDATQAALKMAVDLKAMVSELQAGAPPATQHLEFPELAELARRLFREARVKQVYVVLNKVSSAEAEAYMRQQLAAAGIEPLGVLRPNNRIASAWLRGDPLVEDPAGSVGDWIAKALEADQRVPSPVMS